MATERVTERSDGVMRERVIEREAGGSTTYVDRGGGSGVGGVIVGVAILALVAIVAFFLLQSSRNDAMRTNAVTSNAAQNAADAVTPNETAKGPPRRPGRALAIR